MPSQDERSLKDHSIFPICPYQDQNNIYEEVTCCFKAISPMHQLCAHSIKFDTFVTNTVTLAVFRLEMHFKSETNLVVHLDVRLLVHLVNRQAQDGLCSSRQNPYPPHGRS